MVQLQRCLRLLDEGFSLITVGNNKVPNYSWASCQSKQLTKVEFEKRYNYKGGYIKKDGTEMQPTEHIGIVTGFGYLECLDIDLKVFSTAKEQKEWWEEFLSFVEDNILDFHEKFVITKTKNAGFHILYKTKRVEGNLKIASLKGHKEAIIETRGIGGYVFVYDNFLNNKTYNDIDFISDEDREILFSISKTYNYIEPEKVKPPSKEKKEYQSIDGNITPWDDFNSRNNVWDIVSDDFTIVRNLNNKYIIKRHNAESAHSGYIFKDEDLMYLHSTGTIYEAEKQYSAFTAYVRKHFNDDFSEATKQIYKDGYGSRIVRKETEPKEKIIINKKDLDFPIEVFPQPIQTYILECASTLNSNVDYMGCAMLWLISLCIGNCLKIEVKKGWMETASIWMAVVGKAGIGKTPSISNIIFPLEKQNNREISKYIKEYEKYEYYESLTAKEKKEHPEAHKPVKKQFIANDITLEALVSLHQENDNAVGVFKDELAGWFKDMNKYKQGSDLEFWLSTWSGKSVNLNRITRAGSFVSSPMIPILGGIQPSIFNSFYTEENKDNGFMDRMLLSYPDLEVEKYNETEMEWNTIQWFHDTVVSFYETIKNKMLVRDKDGQIEPHIIKFNKESKKEWIRIFNEITDIQNSDSENEYMKSMLPKQKSYIPRFALMINTMDGFLYQNKIPSEISKVSILKAEKLSKYFIAMAKKIKIDSIEVAEMKNVLTNNRTKTNKEKFEILFKSNPDLNKKEASEQLGVSLQMIYKYIKQIEDEKMQRV
jgi:hypothetical protein